MPQDNIKIIEEGIQYNIDDARNTIKQIKAYLGCIYELLLKSIDQLLKLTSDTDIDGDFNNQHLDAVVIIVNEFVKEINNIVSNAQYNGRKLLRDTNDTDTAIIFRMAANNGICRVVNSAYNDFTINIPLVGINALGIEPFGIDFSDVFM